MTETNPLVQTRSISKEFGGVRVLNDIHFNILPGEIHGLLGENGAGKSTLAKIIAGIHQPTTGHIEVNGAQAEIGSPGEAAEIGIALIHQEPQSFPDLTVAENIFIGRQPTRNGFGRIFRAVNWRQMETEASQLMTQLGLSIDPSSKMRGLSIADQQMVDMASALSQSARVLLMDEPTASLTPSEVQRLFKIMRSLRDEGAGIVFVSHRLEEVFEICDRITVLRDGEYVGERQTEESNPDEIINMMVGRSVTILFEKAADHEIGQKVLEVAGLTRRKKFTNISFDLRAGEIVGMAGLVGAGRTDVGKALFGIQAIDAGQIKINEEAVQINSPREALTHGMVYVPEDRQAHGLLMPMSVAQNGTISILQRIMSGGWLNDQTERDAMAEYVDKLSINLRHVDQTVRELSGGNQQKVVLSKWLMTEPKIMILDEPTRGIDVGAKAEIHRLMGELTWRGIAILMISSELPEVLALSDRIVVMREGQITAEFERERATAEKVIAAATGQHTDKIKEMERQLEQNI